MKKFVISLIIMSILLMGCAPSMEQDQEKPDEAVLLVVVGDSQHSFSRENLQALPSAEASFKEVAYKGVTVSVLLESISIDLDAVKALKAVALDGYSVNYDPAQVLKDNVLVAYELTNGSPLTADDGDYRMVLPEEGGKLNLRMLAEIQIIE